MKINPKPAASPFRFYLVSPNMVSASGFKNLVEEPAAVAKAAESRGFKGEKDQVMWLSPLTGPQICLLGTGDPEKLDAESWLGLGGLAQRQAKSQRASKATLSCPAQEPEGGALQNLILGLELASYRFDNYKSKKQDEPAPSVQWTLVATKTKAKQSIVKRATVLAKAVSRARDWGNEPGGSLTPMELAKRCRSLARGSNVSITVFDEARIKKEKMNLFLSVSAGSTLNPPRFIHVTYKPTKPSKRKVFIVGKGVTFDTGGISLKPAGSMVSFNMKIDMGGAAAALNAVFAAAELGLDFELHAVVPATENMPDGHSTRPGDVIVGRGGKSVEILNTDAEGRLILADALTYSLDKGATEIVDLATLTGAAMAALGPHTAALYSDDNSLQDQLKAAAARAGEHLWPMPLSQHLRKTLDSSVADLKNIGGAYGGSITAALFLKEFVGDVPWAHIDMAGPALCDEDRGHLTKGARGYGVATIFEYLLPLD